jgi:hypothetical protein
MMDTQQESISPEGSLGAFYSNFLPSIAVRLRIGIPLTIFADI